MKRVLLTSIGKRTYLAKYFTYAFGENQVFVADADEDAPGMHIGLTAIQLPPTASSDYIETLNYHIRNREIDLLLSLHDQEVATISRERDRLPARCTILGMPREQWNIGLDKYQTYKLLERVGIRVPKTVLLNPTEAFKPLETRDLSFPVIVKPRFGSASTGVQVIASNRELWQHQSEGSTDALLQEFIVGTEYGLDIISDFEARFLGALARRKLQMSNGETDDAVTVDVSPFEGLARSLASSTRHTGPIDVDILIDHTGDKYVIDMNPRFGGGYPFSHAAGADIPRALHSLTTGDDVDPECLNPRTGVRSRKTIDVVTLER